MTIATEEPGSMKPVLITGASSGIGAACCEWLLARGYQVFAGMRSPNEDARLKQQYGERYQVLALDVTDAESIESAMNIVQSRTDGKLSALINNAGVAYSGALETLPMHQVRSLFDVNVLGTFAMTQACIPLLRASRGRVVMMGSISGILGIMTVKVVQRLIERMPVRRHLFFFRRQLLQCLTPDRCFNFTGLQNRHTDTKRLEFVAQRITQPLQCKLG